MLLIFISSFQRGYVRQSGNNLLEHEKVFQIIGIVLTTEQSVKLFKFISQGFCLNFKSTFTFLKQFMNDFGMIYENTLRRLFRLICFISRLTIKINHMKVAARNINIQTHQLFSKQRIYDVSVTIVQRKMSGDLTRTRFRLTCRPYL